MNNDIENTSIPKNEINIHSLSNEDDVGNVFEWNGRIFRGIRKKYVDDIRNLIDSGLLDELKKNNLFPKTTITDLELNGYEMVLEHEKIPLTSYVYEWSFTMLKDAAINAIRVNIIADKFGYQTKDCHPYNFIFSNNNPVYIDLGSFFLKPKTKNWLPLSEFMQFYFYPLKLWKNGNEAMIRSFFSHCLRGGFWHSIYYRLSSPFSHFLSTNTIDKLANGIYKYRSLSFVDSADIEKKAPWNLGSTVTKLRDAGMLPFLTVNLHRLEKKVSRIQQRKQESTWSNYHDQYQLESQELKSSSRFNRIVEIINELKITSVFELAGNQGVMSRLLIQQTDVSRVICTDYDANAVDQLYKMCKQEKLNITPLVYNVKIPVDETPLPPLEDRIDTPECSMGLALLHHLILTQGMPLSKIFNRFKVFTSKYVFIEFMPLGLWSKQSPNPHIPDWYNVDWFREEFCKNFELVIEEQLETNRILFVGKLTD